MYEIALEELLYEVMTHLLFTIIVVGVIALSSFLLLKHMFKGTLTENKEEKWFAEHWQEQIQQDEHFPRRSSSSENPKPLYWLQTDVFLIPHPDKVDKGGEDSFFVSSDQKALGIADGVGGWSLYGVDPAIYSNCLMTKAREFYENKGQRDPIQLLQFGFESAKEIIGSSTACILYLDEELKLQSANLGDSGFLVIRENKIIYHSKEQQHTFNFPVQLGTGHSTTPTDADAHTLHVQTGDIVILASDGLFDNLFEWEIVELVQQWQHNSIEITMIDHHDNDDDQNNNNNNNHSTTIEEISLSKWLALHARQRAVSLKESSPFSRQAHHLGLVGSPFGGKLDDITVLSAIVSEQSSSSQNSLS